MGYGVTDDFIAKITELKKENRKLSKIIENQTMSIRSLESEINEYKRKLGLPVTSTECHYCGSDSLSFGSNATNEIFWISCNICHATGPSKDNYSEAIEAWESFGL